MNTSLKPVNLRFQNGANIHLFSFVLPKNIVNDKDEVRVSITTLPEEKKENFTFEGAKMYNAHHVFTLNVTNETSKIIIVFRKKSKFSNSPIIASTSFHMNDFINLPNEQITNGMFSTETKMIYIYYPFQKQKKEEKNGFIERRILGQMLVQLTFSAPFLDKELYKPNKATKVQSNMKKSKNNAYGRLIEENNYDNSYLL